ncbi:Transcription factor GAMYB [Dendrobium catenatum]|uniref:Transcription factor GAMYB n=2 Tax=Dendrobium catenatum TaxID=906689 RepID=A0A2I0WW20_9ASPA|nr:Transcription factor GAMYB [Dendrobium catenatum]
MQARFGNKWARIATFLEGRTDNDVKNFWSTRQKRLARLLQTPLPVRSQRRQKNSPVSSQVPDSEGVLLPNENSPSLDLIQITKNYSNDQYSYAPYVEGQDSTKIMESLNLDAATTLLEPAIIRDSPQLSIDHSLFDLPPLAEEQPGEISFHDHFILEENFDPMELPITPPTTFFDDVDFDDHYKQVEHPGTLESIFDDKLFGD